MYTHHCAHSPGAPRVQRVAEKLAGNGSVSISKAIRNKELEIIPISPSVKSGSSAAHGSVPPHRDKSEPKVSISTVAAAARLSNGVPGGAAWREESASVSIEPCGPAPPMPAGPPGSDDAPLNLSMKTEGIKADLSPPGLSFTVCMLYHREEPVAWQGLGVNFKPLSMRQGRCSLCSLTLFLNLCSTPLHFKPFKVWQCNDRQCHCRAGHQAGQGQTGVAVVVLSGQSNEWSVGLVWCGVAQPS
ncbi:hypothetical protein E2C01_002752 [Portunus trituberculatus]|uniref:Uncharacterized protein n=1 Tax=Portunus trituberculatus TaxID=210409 RepID=A0A5B7CRK0_PORTR|nr:hypothetical protein [Portunus trituberculatus]